ncbi:MAG: Asp23/Gls24 family envelope stress response protein [Atopobiaceae bacterium]|nr:Asp23/Gls24 family envelope stress response protein [Atopobiaceae bacterium]
MVNEVVISGVTVSSDVINTIVIDATEGVEGVAYVEGTKLSYNLISMIRQDAPVAPAKGVEIETEGEKLKLRVHVAAFFGYPFTKLASGVREAVADAMRLQVGAEVSEIDVCIEELVFPKE